MESKSFEQFSFREEVGKFEKILEGLKGLLRIEAEKLRGRGFNVDDECRIDMTGFGDFFGRNRIDNDLKQVAQKERRFTKTVENDIGRKKSEILEIVKTLAFNNLWFGKKLLALRTSKYDDYNHNVDQLIFDLETKFPIAAVDVTMNVIQKTESLLKNIENGSQIKYGFDLTNDTPKKVSYTNLPFFIIFIENNKVLEVARSILSKKGNPQDINISTMVIRQLKSQSGEFMLKTSDPTLKKLYKRAGTIFDKLLAL